MRFCLLAVALATGAAGSAAAFVPTTRSKPLASRASRAHSRLAAADTGAFLVDENGKKGKLVVSFEPVDDSSSTPPSPSSAPEPNKSVKTVFPGVDLPENEVPNAIPYPSVDGKVEAFFGVVLNPAAAISVAIGESKSSSTFETSQKALIDSQNLGYKIPESSEYKFFGNSDHSTNLMLLLKTNPFMATALTEKKGGFELRGFDKKGVGESSALYQKILSTLDGKGYRVNIRFNSKMSRIKRVSVYDDVTGDKIKDLRPDDGSDNDKEIDYWASSAAYGLIFYASCVHATFHVLHYHMTAALDYCSDGFDAMNKWAKFYATNIPSKYQQVSELLIRGQPPINAILGLSPGEVTGGFLDSYALITGTAGFGASGTKLVPILQELLETWGANPSDYLDNMMNIPDSKMEEGDILTEFKKHHALVKPYASSASEALRNIDEDKHTIAELRLKDYLKRCNWKSNINTLEEWIDLMSTTGIVHGSTLSYTRLAGHADILRWRNVQSDVWQEADLNLHIKLLGTICGMDEHRNVMTSATDTEGETYANELQDVLLEYDTKATKLKEDYKNKIMENREEFNNFGWILSDFCPNGFDGKQLTITTYI